MEKVEKTSARRLLLVSAVSDLLGAFACLGMMALFIFLALTFLQLFGSDYNPAGIAEVFVVAFGVVSAAIAAVFVFCIAGVFAFMFIIWLVFCITSFRASDFSPEKASCSYVRFIVGGILQIIATVAMIILAILSVSGDAAMEAGYIVLTVFIILLFFVCGSTKLVASFKMKREANVSANSGIYTS